MIPPDAPYREVVLTFVPATVRPRVGGVEVTTEVVEALRVAIMDHAWGGNGKAVVVAASVDRLCRGPQALTALRDMALEMGVDVVALFARTGDVASVDVSWRCALGLAGDGEAAGEVEGGGAVVPPVGHAALRPRLVAGPGLGDRVPARLVSATEAEVVDGVDFLTAAADGSMGYRSTERPPRHMIREGERGLRYGALLDSIVDFAVDGVGGEGRRELRDALNRFMLRAKRMPDNVVQKMRFSVEDGPRCANTTGRAAALVRRYRCGLCGQEGHNRITCPDRPRDGGEGQGGDRGEGSSSEGSSNEGSSSDEQGSGGRQESPGGFGRAGARGDGSSEGAEGDQHGGVGAGGLHEGTVRGRGAGRGPSRCGHCGGFGHNVRGCPDRRGRQDAGGEADGTTARPAKRGRVRGASGGRGGAGAGAGANTEGGEGVGHRSNAPRSRGRVHCTKCGLPGHNSRTCKGIPLEDDGFVDDRSVAQQRRFASNARHRHRERVDAQAVKSAPESSDAESDAGQEQGGA